MAGLSALLSIRGKNFGLSREHSHPRVTLQSFQRQLIPATRCFGAKRERCRENR
jgi:hypothetical protein